MTKPTPAQIDDAAADKCTHDFAERESSVYTEGYCPICMAEHIKELTAAAEVGDKPWARAARLAAEKTPDAFVDAIRPAAGAGEPSTSLLSTAIENVKAETIERCAQVADSFSQQPGLETAIAAAIRALTAAK